MRRYGGLRKATITVRDDGLLDVVRERDTGNGETFRGCATLDEACSMVLAHSLEFAPSPRASLSESVTVPGSNSDG